MTRLRFGVLAVMSLCVSIAHCDDAMRTIRFVGNETFSADQLENALGGEPDYLIAAHPLAPPGELPGVTEKLLRAGYRNRGFRDVAITASALDSSGVMTCQITEGPRYRRRDVHIDGCRQINQVIFRDRLTKPFPKEELTPNFREIRGETQTRWIDKKGNEAKLNDPVWERGEPATFGNERSLNAKVKQALKELGFSNAFFIVRIQSDQNAHAADLVVSIIDEGQPDIAKDVVIDGLKLHSRGQLIDFLELEPTQVINRPALTELRRKLWESGRFQSYDVEFDPKTKILNLTLDEVDAVPTVDEPIDEYAKVLMKTRDWLSKCDQVGLDMHVRYAMGNEGRLSFIQSSEGVLLEITRLDSARNEEGTSGTTLTIMADQESILMDQSDHPALIRFGSAAVDGKLHFSSTMRVANNEKRTINQVFHFNTSTERGENDSAIAHHWTVSRADFMSIIYKPDLAKRFSDDEMVIEHNDLQMTLDRHTGSVKRWAVKDGEVSFRKGIFSSARRRIQQSLDSKPNVYDSRRSFSSLIAYCISHPVLIQLQGIAAASENPISVPNPVALSAARKLVDAGIFAIPDAFISYIANKADIKHDDKFLIPGGRPKSSDVKSMFIELGAGVVLKLAPKALPDEGWPLKVTREACLIAMGRGKYSGAVLKELMEDPNAGPLCHASVAYLLGLLGQDHRKAFAARGLSVMTAEHFANDYELLCALTHHDLVMKTIQSIQCLNEEELEAMLSFIPNESIANVLRLAAIHPLDETRSQSDYWFEISREKLEPWLKKMTR